MSESQRASRQREFVTRAGRKLHFSTLGFGSAPLGNYTRPLSEAECEAILAAAWNSRLRYFDTAPLYGLGLSEMRVGGLLRKHANEPFTISTKVGRLLEPCEPGEVNGAFFVNTPQVRFVYDYSYDAVMRSYEESLERLGLDRVDILFVHDVDAFCHGSRAGSEARIQELVSSGGWRALDELRSSGAISAIGAGVNEWEPCARLLELVDPDLFLLAGRYTLLEQAPLDTLLPECSKRGVGIVIGGPYNSGILAGKATYNYSDVPAAVLERVRSIDAVCREHGVPLNCAALQFVLAHPAVVSVIPGSQSVAENDQNVAALETPIPDALWADLKRLNLLHAQAPTPSGN
ncbi:MAG TPA: aldo/keto reductase [Steroidobacteraceae bacterium]|nr:aldo/keto reductase [Steroidobacteraceae bacterium]